MHKGAASIIRNGGGGAIHFTRVSFVRMGLSCLITGVSCHCRHPKGLPPHQCIFNGTCTSAHAARYDKCHTPSKSYIQPHSIGHLTRRICLTLVAKCKSQEAAAEVCGWPCPAESSLCTTGTKQSALQCKCFAWDGSLTHFCKSKEWEKLQKCSISTLIDRGKISDSVIKPKVTKQWLN